MPRLPCLLGCGAGRNGAMMPGQPEAQKKVQVAAPHSPTRTESSGAESEVSPAPPVSSRPTSLKPATGLPPPRLNFRAAVRAVQASNRIGCFSVDSESAEQPAARRRASRRISLVEQIRRRTRGFTSGWGAKANASFDISQEEQIHELTELMKPGMPLGNFTDFAKEYGDETFLRRLLRKYPNNVPKCADKLRQALTWREQHRELLTTRKCPQAGDYRVIGSDHEQHPVLYMCMRNQLLPLGQCVDFMMVAMLRAIDNMPAGVEAATHIWDLHGLMIRMNWNPAPLVAILKAAEGYFAERMHELIIIDMPRVASFLKDAVWPLVPETTKEKVKFLSAAEAENYVRQNCPVDVAGRIRDSMAQNRDSSVSLEERKRSWMRVNEHGELVPAFASTMS